MLVPLKVPHNYGGNQDALGIALEGWPLNSGGAYGKASEWNDIQGTNTLTFVVEFEWTVTVASMMERDTGFEATLKLSDTQITVYHQEDYYEAFLANLEKASFEPRIAW